MIAEGYVHSKLQVLRIIFLRSCGQNIRKPASYFNRLVNVNPLISFLLDICRSPCTSVFTKWMKCLVIKSWCASDLSLCGAHGVSSPRAVSRCSPPRTGPAFRAPCFSHCRTAGYWCSVWQTEQSSSHKSPMWRKCFWRRVTSKSCLWHLFFMASYEFHSPEYMSSCCWLDRLSHFFSSAVPQLLWFLNVFWLKYRISELIFTLMVRSWLLGRCGSGGLFWLSVW